MSKQVLLVLADGFEEIEAITPADVLRRAGANVTLGALDNLTVKGSQGVKVLADKLLTECIDDEFDLIVLPGGQPGTNNLRDSDRLNVLLQQQNAAGRYIGAICAAPALVLHHRGLLQEKIATCHPSLVRFLPDYSDSAVVVAGNIISSQAPGTAFTFALKLVEILFGADKAQQLAQSMVVT